MIKEKCKVYFSRYLILFVIVALFLPSVVFSLSFPPSPFFSYRPGYGFKLISDQSNTIEVQTSVELSDRFYKTGLFYYKWKIYLHFNQSALEYQIKFRVNKQGNLYVDQLSDGLFIQHDFSQEPLIPVEPIFNKVFRVSDSISFKFLRIIPQLKVNNQIYRKVTESSLQLGKEEILLYLVEKNGIIGIKTEQETFK